MKELYTKIDCLSAVAWDTWCICMQLLREEANELPNTRLRDYNKAIVQKNC